jgi:shikimate kinase
MRIYLLGFMGAGKSFWGKQLSQHFQAPFFDLDTYIIEQDGRSVNDIFTEEGEAYFRLLEKKALETLTETYPQLIVATGGGTPCFHGNMNYMTANGKTIWLNPPVDVLMQRLEKEKDHRPLLKSLNNDELRKFIEEKLGERIKFYEKSLLQLNNDEDLSVEVFIKMIKHA